MEITMKKDENNSTSLTVLAISLLVFLAGCGSSDSDDSDLFYVPDEENTTSVTADPSTKSATIVVSDGEVVKVEIPGGVLEGINPLRIEYNIVIDADVREGVWDFGDGSSVGTEDEYSVAYTYTRPGTFDDGSVTLQTEDIGLDESGFNDGIVTIPLPKVEVLPNINLVITSFAMDKQIEVGGTETVSAIIQNIGTDPLEADGLLHVGYYLSLDKEITVDDIYIGDTTIVLGAEFSQAEVPFGAEKLSPGENFQYDHQLAIIDNTPQGSGQYYLGALVDYIDYYHWSDFPRSTDTLEYLYPRHIVVAESNEQDNTRVISDPVTVTNGGTCTEDSYEPDDNASSATMISPGQSQNHNFCYDNADWVKFEAVQGNIYKISTFNLGVAADTQLILYDRDGTSILLFHDNICPGECGDTTVDLASGWPEDPRSEIVWEAEFSGTYYVKARVTTCDSDLDYHCSTSPQGAGANTEYTISLE